MFVPVCDASFVLSFTLSGMCFSACYQNYHIIHVHEALSFSSEYCPWCLFLHSFILCQIINILYGFVILLFLWLQSCVVTSISLFTSFAITVCYHTWFEICTVSSMMRINHNMISLTDKPPGDLHVCRWILFCWNSMLLITMLLAIAKSVKLYMLSVVSSCRMYSVTFDAKHLCT